MILDNPNQIWQLKKLEQTVTRFVSISKNFCVKCTRKSTYKCLLQIGNNFPDLSVKRVFVNYAVAGKLRSFSCHRREVFVVIFLPVEVNTRNVKHVGAKGCIFKWWSVDHETMIFSWSRKQLIPDETHIYVLPVTSSANELRYESLPNSLFRMLAVAMYCKVSNIRRTKSQNLKASRLIL